MPLGAKAGAEVGLASRDVLSVLFIFAGPSSFLPTVCRYSVREHRAFFESYRLAFFPLLLCGIDSRAARLFCIDF